MICNILQGDIFKMTLHIVHYFKILRLMLAARVEDNIVNLLGMIQSFREKFI